jgi:hypothetical protein
VSTLPDRSIVHEVLVQLRLEKLLSIVRVGKLENGETVLVSVGLEDVGEVGSLCLGRDAESVGSIAGETGNGVHSRLGDPDGVVFLQRERKDVEKSASQLDELRAVMEGRKREGETNLDGSLDGSLEPDVVGLLLWRAMSVRNGGCDRQR